jgi:uncharacterized protein YjdB
MKRWKHYLFLCVAFGFLYVCSDPIYAKEVEQSEVIAQAETSDSVAINSSVSGTDAESTPGDQQDATQQEDNVEPTPEDTQTNIEYTSHIQGNGWETQEHTNGELSGTTGENKRLEAIQISLPDHNNELQYQVHVQNIGWMDYVSGGEVAGTTGQAKRIEAIRIRLSGNLANTYNVVYRTHVQNYGWLKWVMNDTISGTTGQSLRIEAIEILLAKKDVEAATGNDVVYDSHVQNIGWQEPVVNGETAGTTGKSKRVEAFHVYLQNQTLAGQLFYQAHVAGIGWQNWMSNEKMAGTTGQSRQIEAIRLKLDGAIADMYDIYYRVHVQDYGWLAWTTTGQAAGTTGLSKRIEAFELLMIAREQDKPFSNSTVSFIDHKKTINYVDTKTGVNYVNDGNSQVVSRSNGIMVYHVYRWGNTVYVINSSGIVTSSRPFSPTSVRYMSQLDRRWAYRYYGGMNIAQSGCVGTVSAMILDALLNVNFTPVDTCNYYWNGGYYNHREPGTTADGIPALISEYGLNIQNHMTFNSLVTALKSGALIAADIHSMQYGVGAQHEILLKGYSNGNTYVYDPYYGSLNGWANLQNIWNHRSYWETRGGGPFFAIS